MILGWRWGLAAGLIALTAAGWGWLGGVGQAERRIRIGEPAPEVAGGPWINSPPLALAGLRGRVVLVEFWTYG